MEVKIISDKIQEFNGERYWLCGHYFSRNMKKVKPRRLHREVWIYHFKNIPKGYHVHHRDENRSNNQIENLTLLKAGAHLKLHQTPERRAWARENLAKNARPAAIAWHKSAAAKPHYDKLAVTMKKFWKDRKPKHAKVCSICEIKYMAFFPKSIYCGKKCKSRGWAVKRLTKQAL
jgi:hypothetical protein